MEAAGELPRAAEIMLCRRHHLLELPVLLHFEHVRLGDRDSVLLGNANLNLAASAAIAEIQNLHGLFDQRLSLGFGPVFI